MSPENRVLQRKTLCCHEMEGWMLDRQPSGVLITSQSKMGLRIVILNHSRHCSLRNTGPGRIKVGLPRVLGSCLWCHLVLHRATAEKQRGKRLVGDRPPLTPIPQPGWSWPKSKGSFHNSLMAVVAIGNTKLRCESSC